MNVFYNILLRYYIDFDVKKEENNDMLLENKMSFVVDSKMNN